MTAGLRAGTIVPNGTIAPPDKAIGAIVPIVTHHGGLVIPVMVPPVPWSLIAWRDFRDERRAIRQYDGEMSEPEAAHWAWLDCIAKWLERHPPLPVARKAWTGTAEEFRLCRIQDACIVLERLGIREPVLESETLMDGCEHVRKRE
jgi:hypothetical protein